MLDQLTDIVSCNKIMNCASIKYVVELRNRISRFRLQLAELLRCSLVEEVIPIPRNRLIVSWIKGSMSQITGRL
jgi:hypothetical protein